MIAQLAGYQVGFDDSGDGLPVVFLHGFPHDRTLWTAQRMSLAPQVRCIVPDLRGFGHSSTFGPFSMDQYADDVVALLDGKVRWDWPLYYRIAKAFKAAAKAEGVPLEWGGDWKMRDGPHFQLPWKQYPKGT